MIGNNVSFHRHAIIRSFNIDTIVVRQDLNLQSAFCFLGIHTDICTLTISILSHSELFRTLILSSHLRNGLYEFELEPSR